MTAIPYSINDFIKWQEDGELVISPEFQRRSVWPPKARAYLIDTIIRRKPIPKIYMRQEINLETRRTRREIVDGQQRIRAILDFINGIFSISKAYNDELGGKHFSDLDDEIQHNILNYKLSVELLENMPDVEIHDIFTRLNTFSFSLKAQEIRNGKYFGEFKTLVYKLDKEFLLLWKNYGVFSDRRIARMEEAEFISELLIAMCSGISQRERKFIDNFYESNDDVFPNKQLPAIDETIPNQVEIAKRFRDIMDIVGTLLERTETDSKIRESRMVYALFCALYHLQYGLPKESWKRKRFSVDQIGIFQDSLTKIEDIFQRVQKGKEESKRRKDFNDENITKDDLNDEELETWEYDENDQVGEIDPLYLLRPREKEFYDAYDTRWVHASKRKFRTRYIVNLFMKNLQ